MLRKVLIFGAICTTMTCGISFGKTTALDIANRSLKGLEEAGLKYTCRVGETPEVAKCLIRDISHHNGGIKNIQYDFTITNSLLKVKTSADIVVNLKMKEIQKFIPKHVACETESKLTDFKIHDFETCLLQSDTATLKVDSKTFIKSKKFQYKTMYGVLEDILKQVEHISKKAEDIDTKYFAAKGKLLEERESKLNELYSQREILDDTYSSLQKDSCSYPNTDKREVQKLLHQNNDVIEKTRSDYTTKLNNLDDKYQQEQREFTRELTTLLKQYNVNIKELRLYITTNKLAESVFDVFAKESFSSYGKFVEPENKKEYTEKVKRIYAEYYSFLESGRATAITLLAHSRHLNADMIKNLSKIVSEHLKLYDPNSHKRSMRILVRHLNKRTFNLGEEFERIIDSKNNEVSMEKAKQRFFEILNEYEIKAVRYWPLDNK